MVAVTSDINDKLGGPQDYSHFRPTGYKFSVVPIQISVVPITTFARETRTQLKPLNLSHIYYRERLQIRTDKRKRCKGQSLRWFQTSRIDMEQYVWSIANRGVSLESLVSRVFIKASSCPACMANT